MELTAVLGGLAVETYLACFEYRP